MNIRRLLLLCACVLLVASCATTRPQEAAAPSADPKPAIASIRLCQTTFEQLRAQLGEPSRDGIIHRKRVVTWITALNPLVRYLGVLLNDKGVVVDMYWDVPTEIVWEPVDQCR